MFSSSFLILSVSLACRAITLPFNQVQGSGAYLQGAAASDLQRAFGHRKTIHAVNLGFQQYTVSVGVGDPPTYYELVVDTGSSNTWVGAGTPYVSTHTSFPTGQTMMEGYISGNVVGPEVLDQITLASGFVIQNQSIGAATQAQGFSGVDGVIGVGPADLTVDTLFPDTTASISTVVDNAFSQGLIPTEVIGISFAPADSSDTKNGAVTFGGDDNSLFTGEINYAPLTSTWPSSDFWGINATATYGTTSIISESTAGIVDSGTTLILLADDFFSTYQAAIPGSYVDNNGYIVIPPSQIANLLPFNFTINGNVYSLDANAQLRPQDQNAAWGGDPSLQYGHIGPSGFASGAGLDFTIGQKFMERYYVVFDKPNQRVGFASTTNTFGPSA